MLIYLIIFLVTLSILFVRKRFSYWADNGVPFIKPSFPFGNVQGIGRSIHLSELTEKFYHELKGKSRIGGMYFFIQPMALVLDLDLINDIFIKSFHHFQDRALYYNEKDDPLSAHLLSMEGERWHNLRVKLTPTFTSGKLKMMFPTVVGVGEHFEECMHKSIQNSSMIEMKDILSRFTMDLIGTCAFGLECNSLNDPNSEFRLMGQKVFDIPRGMLLKLLFMSTFPNLSRKLHLTQHSNVSDFFLNVVRDTIEYREKNNVQRLDFMNLLIQLKNTGKLDDSEEESTGKLTLNEIAAQAFIFFLAGHETSSTAMTFCLYELAMNQEVQDKARIVVQNAIKKHGSLTYEASMEMKYIDQCIYESLRKYPPISNLVRNVTKNYQVPGTNCILEKGTNVFIPIHAIQRDPEHFPDPQKFDPDRFTPENVAQRHAFSFLPFGEGPRMCIGLRFGMIQARVGLATLLNKFTFKPCSKSTIPIEIDCANFVLTPKGGLWLNVEKNA